MIRFRTGRKHVRPDGKSAGRAVIRPIVHDKSLIDLLTFHPEKFSFAKAMDIAVANQKLSKQSISIEIKSCINYSSKYVDIAAVEGIKDEHIEMHVNLQGIAGIDGSLPDCYVEKYITHNRTSKAEVVDFFDIFNDKILSLRYKQVKRHDITCQSAPLSDSVLGRIIASLSGLNTNELGTSCQADRDVDDVRIPDQFMVSAQNLLWRGTRSSEGMRIMLTSLFHVPVEIEQFMGGFVEADPLLQTAIGISGGRFNKLGRGACLGRKLWDVAGGIHIVIGPLEYADYISFLPKGNRPDGVSSRLRKMAEIVRSYINFEISVRLIFCLTNDENAKKTYLGGTRKLGRDAFVFGGSMGGSTDRAEFCVDV